MTNLTVVLILVPEKEQLKQEFGNKKIKTQEKTDRYKAIMQYCRT